MRGTRAERANVFAHSICKFECTDRKHEMRHEHSEVRVKSQIALQFTAEEVARGMDGRLPDVQQYLISVDFVLHI